MERLVDDVGDVAGIPDQVVVLGDRHGDAGRVGLLERIGADEPVGHLAGDGDDRHRVEVGIGQRRHDVGRRRSAGHHDDAGLAGRVGIARRHVPGALFVPDQHVTDAGIEHRVVDGQDGAARIPEYHFDAFEREGLQ